MHFVSELPDRTKVGNEVMHRVEARYNVEAEVLGKFLMETTNALVQEVVNIQKDPAAHAAKLNAPPDQHPMQFIQSLICACLMQTFLAGSEAARRWTFPELLDGLNEFQSSIEKELGIE